MWDIEPTPEQYAAIGRMQGRVVKPLSSPTLKGYDPHTDAQERVELFERKPKAFVQKKARKIDLATEARRIAIVSYLRESGKELNSVELRAVVMQKKHHMQADLSILRENKRIKCRCAPGSNIYLYRVSED